MKESTSRTAGNSMSIPSENEFTAQQRLTEQMARGIVNLLATGSFAPGGGEQSSSVPNTLQHSEHSPGVGQ